MNALAILIRATWRKEAERMTDFLIWSGAALWVLVGGVVSVALFVLVLMRSGLFASPFVSGAP